MLIMDNKRQNELFLRILKHIENNLHRSITLDEIAKSAYLSKYHLHRLMKEFLEEPLSSYITGIKMERALMYLKTTSKKISEIANELGYESVNSFIKAFKKRFGVSPTTLIAGFKFENFLLEGKLSDSKINYIDTTYALYAPVLGKYGGKRFDETWSLLIDYVKRENIINERTRYLGIYFDDPKVTKESKCRAYVCVTVDNPIKTSSRNISLLKIDPGFYAVYTFQGNYDELPKVYDCIFDKEVSNLNTYRTHFEEYMPNGESTTPLTKIYIPITKTAR